MSRSTTQSTARPNDRVRGDQLRRSMMLLISAWGFGAAWMYATTGAVQTEFAKSIGLSNFGFGVLAALPFASAFLQLPASVMIERLGHRKLILMLAVIPSRLLWLLLAVLPWALPASWWTQGMLIIVGVALALGQFGVPAWLGWVASWVPARVRGRFNAQRMMVGQICGVFVAVAVGYALDRGANWGAERMRVVLGVVYAFAAVVGVIDLLLHMPVPNTPETTKPHLKMGTILLQPLRDANFRKFLGFTATFTFSVGYVGQFVNLYVRDVALQYVENRFLVMNTMLVAIPILVSVFGYKIWGRLIDRLGNRPVLIISVTMMVHGAISWMFITPTHWWFGYATITVAMLGWPGILLAQFNVLLSMSENRGDSHAGTAYVAVNSVVVAIAGTLSGLFGGVIAEQLGDDWQMVIGGLPITYHGVLFMISGGLRLLSLLWLIGLEEPTAHSARGALRYMAGELYSNVQAFVFMSSRVTGLAGRLSRMTYRINPRPPRSPKEPPEVYALAQPTR